jgi:hypothetical protein
LFWQATASVAPALWQPASGILMTNDISETNPEEAVPCIALSKNDSYVMSASGGKVSLFNMMTFKVNPTNFESMIYEKATINFSPLLTKI